MKYLCFLLLCSQTAFAQWQLKKQIETEDIQPHFIITPVTGPIEITDDCILKPIQLSKSSQPKSGDTTITLICKLQSGRTMLTEFECKETERKCYVFGIIPNFSQICCNQ